MDKNMSIIVSLALATICFTNNNIKECHPVLLGKDNRTPVGEFTLKHLSTTSPGYGGDILQFSEDTRMIYAIHRVWLLLPDQRRLERLHSPTVKDRFVTSGCINVEQEVYKTLIDCCSTERLIIER
jgi:hypothetical protein